LTRAFIFPLLQSALNGSAATTRSHRKIVKTLLVVLGLFIICRGPWHLGDIIVDNLARSEDASAVAVDTVFHQMAALLVMCNSWMTPIVYAMFNFRLREQIFDFLQCSRRQVARVETTHDAQMRVQGSNVAASAAEIALGCESNRSTGRVADIFVIDIQHTKNAGRCQSVPLRSLPLAPKGQPMH
jgi:hypothetical protein